MKVAQLPGMMAPFVFAGGLSMGALCFGISGCGDDTKPAPVQTAKTVNPFKTKDPINSNLDLDTGRAFDALFGKSRTGAHVDNWHRDAQMYFGAADRLYLTMRKDDNTLIEEMLATTKPYREAATAFYGNHYATPADASQEGMLVLIAGLAPISINQSMIFGAIKAMGDKTNGQETHFVELLKGCFHFNKAVEHADKRYSKPNGRMMKPDQKRDAKAQLDDLSTILEVFDKMDKPTRNRALDNEQQVIYEYLKRAAADFEKTLGKIPSPPPTSTSTYTHTPPPITTTTTTPPPTNTGWGGDDAPVPGRPKK